MKEIENFLREYDHDSFQECEKLRVGFVKDYPIDTLSSLTLEDYCWTGRKSTFCYRLEHELQPKATFL